MTQKTQGREPRAPGLFERKWGTNIFDWANNIFMFVLAIAILYPLYFVLVASFTDPTVVSTGKLLLYPETLYLGGYRRVFAYTPIWRGYSNTILYTTVGTSISLLVTIPGAYTLSRKDLPFRRQLMFLFTFTMFFSGGLIPMFLLLNTLSLYNTIWAVTLPGAVSVYNLIVCRTFFSTTLPDELLEAARIEGCDDFGFFFRIALPLSSTIVTVMILFYATSIWNSFMNALMFLGDAAKMPLQVVLRNLILINEATMLSSEGVAMVERIKIAEQLKFGIIVVAALPLLMVYPFLQRYITKGVMIGAIKG
ncbi:MAG: carbohydrate ABC transporter permease [Oscillospiraceae bacterium]|nr:carbohydrate ABC transporter permease [Oscillospiraceae bacterium]